MINKDICMIYIYIMKAKFGFCTNNMARPLQKDSETKLPRLQLPWTNETKILSLNPVNRSNNEKESATTDAKVGSQTRRPRKQNPRFFGSNWINLTPELLFDLHPK